MATYQLRRDGEHGGFSWTATGGSKIKVGYFKNSFEYSVTITKFSIALGTGTGPFFNPNIGQTADVQGNGVTFSSYISAGSVNSGSYTISNRVQGGQVSGDWKNPTLADMRWHTFTLNSAITLTPDQDVTFYINISPGAQPTGSFEANVLCAQTSSWSGNNGSGDGTYTSGYPYITYTPGTFNVVLNPNGGKVEGSTSSVTKTKTGGVALSLPAPTKDNTSLTTQFNVNGHGTKPANVTSTVTWSPTSGNIWNTKSDGSGTKYTTSYSVEAATTLYAQYTPTYGSITLPAVADAGDYTFNGWYTAATGGTRVGGAGGSYTPKASGTLYAQWKRKVFFDGNSSEGTVTDIPGTVSGDIGTDITLPSTVPKKYYKVTYNANGGSVSPTSKNVYCTFNGWNTKANGTGTTYQPGATYSGNTTITLYAQWTNPQIGELPTPTYDVDHQLECWTRTLNNRTTQITSSYVLTSDITIYALWKYRVMMYSVSATGEGEFVEKMSGDASEQEGDDDKWLELWKLHGTSLSLAHEVYSLDYDLKGWSTTNTATSTVTYPVNGSYSTNSPLTIYAVYEVHKFKVEFLDGYSPDGQDKIYLKQPDGSWKKYYEVPVGGSVPESVVPKPGETYNGKLFQKSIYAKFQGWSGSYENIDADTTLQALWDFSYIWICVKEGNNKVWVMYEPEEV